MALESYERQQSNTERGLAVVTAEASFDNGAKSSIGTTAVQLTTSSITCGKGVVVKADASNSGFVYVGSSSSVTAGSADATDGFQIAAKEGVVVEVDNPNKIYVIGSAAGQKVYWLAV